MTGKPDILSGRYQTALSQQTVFPGDSCNGRRLSGRLVVVTRAACDFRPFRYHDRDRSVGSTLGVSTVLWGSGVLEMTLFGCLVVR